MTDLLFILGVVWGGLVAPFVFFIWFAGLAVDRDLKKGAGNDRR